MAIEFQEQKTKRNYFAYIAIIVILIFTFYILTVKVFKEKNEKLINQPPVDVVGGLSEIKKEKTDSVFEMPIFKSLVKYVPMSIKTKLGRENPFGISNSATSSSQ